MVRNNFFSLALPKRNMALPKRHLAASKTVIDPPFPWPQSVRAVGTGGSRGGGGYGVTIVNVSIATEHGALTEDVNVVVGGAADELVAGDHVSQLVRAAHLPV